MRRFLAKVFTFALAVWISAAFLETGKSQLSLSGAEEIKLALDKLNVLGSVMMIAAHPDDENNALVAYYGRGRKVEMAYLSATRGEGGQNLIGSEQGDLLGLIRTQELIAARRVDGGQQFFTRAIDFGFSKTSSETIEKWGHDTVLSDMVWVIREFRPDVVIQQWSGTNRDGHGHHQAAGILGREAVIAASDPKRFPEQLKWVQPWQVKRMVGRTGGFGPGPPAANGGERQGGNGQARASGGGAAGATPVQRAPGQIDVDTGEFDPVLGKSYTEIGAISRTRHASQGQGSAQRKGSTTSSFILLSGDKPQTDIFDGIDITWSRVPGGAEIGQKLAQANSQYDIQHPEKIIPLLLGVRPAVAKLASTGNIWGERKLRDLDNAVALCAGLFLDAEAAQAVQIPGGKWTVAVTALDRSHASIGPVTAKIEGLGQPVSATVATLLEFNRPANKSIEIAVPGDTPYSQPFWLANPRRGDAYVINDQRLIGRPDPVPVLQATFTVAIGGQELNIAKPVRCRYVDQIEGEKTRPLVVAPAVAVNLPRSAIVFPSAAPKQISVLVRADAEKVSGTLRIEAPAGWKIDPASSPFQFAAEGDEQLFPFTVTPPDGAKPGHFRAIAQVNGKEVTSGVKVISYSHIPPQTVFPPSEGELNPAPLTVLAKRVGYVMGAGDEVPDAIRQMGCDVTLLTDSDLEGADLSMYDAIVTGVRAYDVRDSLRANQQRILKYVEGGGTLVVQYNRSGARLENLMGPYPITLTADRVTVEDAPVAFTTPQSLLLNRPNKITQKDFEGWIQERGIYFASKWDKHYETVIESHDPGEKPAPGGMLMTRYGKGVYIFTGYAWFRQLPAGVPGAYRIFANLLSAGKALN